jgi:hypothetical protein
VALHPHCTVTYNKNAWKGQNSGRWRLELRNLLDPRPRTPEDIISSYRFPTIKVMDLIRREGDQCTVLFLSKVQFGAVQCCAVQCNDRPAGEADGLGG